MHKSRAEGYQKALEKYGISPKALQWSSWESQAKRLRELVKDIDFEGKSVLDVGCGFGDFINYIAAKNINFRYKGIDIVPEFIEFAKNRYSQFEFEARDYFNNPLEENFDIVVTSGTLNNYPENPMEDRKKNIATLWEHTNEVLAFNMAGGHPQPENSPEKRVFYADSLEILNYCFSLSSKVIFRHHYHDKDFTIVIFK